MKTPPSSKSRQLVRAFCFLSLTAVSVTACAKNDNNALTASTSSVADSVAETAVIGEQVEAPLGPDDVLLRIESGVGGFRTFQGNFAALPQLLVVGDGRVFTQGPVLTIYPGPFLPNIQVGKMDSETMRSLLLDAQQSGLTGDIPNYAKSAPNVTDVGSTIVTITAHQKKYVHEAFALGMEQANAAPERAALKKFVDSALAKVDGAATTSYTPESYLLASQAVDLSNQTPAAGDPAPRLVAWPADLGVKLLDLKCVQIDAAKVQPLFEAADQLTYFTQEGATYVLAVRPMFPGQQGCEPITK
jgi:hypothetical protein